MSSEKAADPAGSVSLEPETPRASLSPDAADRAAERRSVLQIGPGGVREASLEVIREVPVTLYVNGEEIVTLLTTLRDLASLAVGFLFSEGWIADRSVIEALRVEEDRGLVHVRLTSVPQMTRRFLEKRMIGSSCGKAVSFYNVLDALHCKPASSAYQVRASVVSRWMTEMLRDAPLYRRTRGTHSVALYQETSRLLLEEDVGRHNAVDRILGRCLLEALPVERSCLLTTGRLSSEMVVKTSRLGIPILASRSAPTSLAVSLADRLRITLLGQVRGERMNAYTHPERVVAAGEVDTARNERS